jgi:hypothetical protein
LNDILKTFCIGEELFLFLRKEHFEDVSEQRAADYYFILVDRK